MNLRSLALAFTAIVGLTGAANASGPANGTYLFHTANGCLDDTGGNSVYLTAASSCSINNAGQAFAWDGSHIGSLIEVTTGANPEPLGATGGNLGAQGDTWTATAVTGGYTILNANGRYLQDSPFGDGSTQTVWSIDNGSGPPPPAGPSIDMSDSSHIAPGANGTVLGVVNGSWAAGVTGGGAQGPAGPQGPAGQNGTNGTNAGQTGLVSAPSTCTTGQSGFDGSFIWVCTATNVTKHVAVQ